MLTSGQRHVVYLENEKVGSQPRFRGMRTAVIGLALSIVAASIWLTMRDVVRTSGPTAISAQSLRAFTPAVTPFSATDLVNPKRGQYQDIGIPLYPQSSSNSYPAWPGTDDSGDRFLWRQVQPTSANRYDFTSIDNEIAAAHARNQRFHFRIMAFASNVDIGNNTVMAVPEWLHATPGATTDYFYAGKKYVVPNWNSDAYLRPLERLIAALGARYDHDERVEWFEFSGYGDWSENHIGFIAGELGAPGPTFDAAVAQLGYYSQVNDQSITKASVTRLVNATLAAFRDTQIVAGDDNFEIVRQFLAASPRRPVGIRADCLGVYPPPQVWASAPDSWYVQQHDPVIAALLARWRTAPVVTEWCNFQPDGASEFFQQALKDTVNYHVSLVGSNVSLVAAEGSPISSPSRFDIWTRTTKYAGYRYAITSTTGPASAHSGSALPISMRWTNFGTAPTYDNWRVEYELRDTGDKVIKTVPSALTLGNLCAEQNYTDTAQEPASASRTETILLPTSGLRAGTYRLVAKVVWNEHKPHGINTVNYPPMALAQVGRDRDGGYSIGSIQVSG
jgi:Domain of unknown function (DUF4832)